MSRLYFIRNWVYSTTLSDENQEMILEALRIGLFAGVSAIVSYILNLLANTPQTEIAIILTVLLKALDKQIFTKQKQTTKARVQLTGLSGF